MAVAVVQVLVLSLYAGAMPPPFGKLFLYK